MDYKVAILKHKIHKLPLVKAMIEESGFVRTS